MNRSNLFLTLSAVVVALTTSTVNVATAQPSGSFPDRETSVEGYLIADFLGKYRVYTDGERRTENDINLDPTVGVGLRLTMRSGMLAFGGMMEVRAYGNDEYDDRDLAYDIAGFIGARVPLIRGDGATVVLRGTLPLGFTILTPNDTTFGRARYYGFNVGALGGVGVNIGRKFGFFADVGVRHHRVFASDDLGPLGMVRASLGWAQLSVNAGASYRF